MNDFVRSDPVPYRIWGESFIEKGAIQQMVRAARLPVSVQGALMPDAHEGYGLPIGGVLATTNAIIPYAVGVDIACRMSMTIFNVSPYMLGQKREKFRQAIEDNTLFGPGREFQHPVEHPVLDDPLFSELAIARKMKDTAYKQLGTSGSGNHFVEFGALTVHAVIEGTGKGDGEGSRSYGTIPIGKYLALVSHSGSRGLGYTIANYYTEIAMHTHQELPKDFQHLAWLDMQTGVGQEYWHAMNLAGRYASANHAVIHQKIAQAMRLEVLGGIENHHNFAWKEVHDGQEVIVHRKGATPAGAGVYGVIPGSMTAPGFVVRGKGQAESLDSASHGAGRQMSRSQAFKQFDWDKVERQLKKFGVELISGGLDESPGAYKDIRIVMEAQKDLVEIVAEFQPILVKMDADKQSRRRRSERLDPDELRRKKKLNKPDRKNKRD